MWWTCCNRDPTPEPFVGASSELHLPVTHRSYCLQYENGREAKFHGKVQRRKTNAQLMVGRFTVTHLGDNPSLPLFLLSLFSLSFPFNFQYTSTATDEALVVRNRSSSRLTILQFCVPGCRASASGLRQNFTFHLSLSLFNFQYTWKLLIPVIGRDKFVDSSRLF